MAWKEGKAECSPLPSLFIHSVCLFPTLLSAPCMVCRVVLVDGGVVSKSSSQLLSPPTTLAPTQGCMRASLPLSQTPAWTHVSHRETSQYSRMGTWTVIVCLHYLCQCTVCSKWHCNAIIHSCHPVLLSIRLMILCNRPGFSGCWNHKCEK